MLNNQPLSISQTLTIRATYVRAVFPIPPLVVDEANPYCLGWTTAAGTQHVYFVHKLHHVFAGHGFLGMMKGKRPRGEPAGTAAMLLVNGRGGSVVFQALGLWVDSGPVRRFG